MPMSFGPVGKAIAVLIAIAFALWLIFTYVFATEEVAEEDAERMGASGTITLPAA